ncbi:MAG: DUF4115 domain-containing protein [Candidatus Omnitrophica bacterium]|nr:DUF4115 domain-containing protein [Candidatus Omnitrophota bacterium]MBU0878708.1 DUF4115 domain-containing protein [Candidatus Omnitrophota bacterium]MBU0896085.1 DUF4115 domain-containing protein [Candidatus Omnitrophota bacterium]MBU1367073.1 DUF4115 domain-containing protein [Candidatus Omnitrophota bacterium]MBU1524373.1 DUF4115 domain-containing protein [Candidatus Omnitrophota bacterium]
MDRLEEFGLKLKEKRKELGLQLEEVVEKTKLHPSVIKDIEGGNLSKMSPIYLKGFIKIYASFLGMETDEVLGKISSPKTFGRDKNSPEVKEETEKKPARKQISLKAKKIIIFSLLAAVFLYSLVVVVRFIAKTASRMVRSSVKSDEKINSQLPPVNPVRENHRLKSADLSNEVNINSEEIITSLTAKKDCFLRIRVDGKLLFEGILKKGMKETWKADKEMELKISDASAVYLEVNGKPLPHLTSMRKPIKSLKITHSGISVEK